MFTKLRHDEINSIANAILPLEKPDLSMLEDHIQREITNTAVKTLLENAKHNYSVESVKKAIKLFDILDEDTFGIGDVKRTLKMYTSLFVNSNFPGTWRLAEPLLEYARKKGDNVNNKLVKLFHSYLMYDESATVPNVDNWDNALRVAAILEQEITDEIITNRSLSILTSDHNYATEVAYAGFNRTKEEGIKLPENNLEKVVANCNSHLFSDEKIEDIGETPAKIFMNEIIEQHPDKLILLAKDAIEKTRLDSALYLSMNLLERENSEEDLKQIKQIMSKMRRISYKRLDLHRIEKLNALDGEEIDYRKLYFCMKEYAQGGPLSSGLKITTKNEEARMNVASDLFWHTRARELMIKIMENAPEEDLEFIAKTEERFLRDENNLKKIGNRAERLYSLAINTYLQLGNEEKAIEIFELADSRGSLSRTYDLDTGKSERLEKRITEISDDRKNKYKAELKERQERAFGSKAQKAYRQIIDREEYWEPIKDAYRKGGFREVENVTKQFVKELGSELDVMCHSAVSIYSQVLRNSGEDRVFKEKMPFSSSREEYDQGYFGGLTEEECKDAAIFYIKQGKDPSGIASRCISRHKPNSYSSFYEKIKKPFRKDDPRFIPQKIWVEGANSILQRLEIDSHSLERFVEYMKVARKKSRIPKAIFDRIGILHLDNYIYSPKQSSDDSSQESSWSFNGEYSGLFTAKMAFKDGSHIWKTFFRKNFNRFLRGRC